MTLKGFRNLADQSLEFDPRANYLFGPNAAGKTSLLEAIHFLAIGRSLRSVQERDVIRFGAELYDLAGEAGLDDGLKRQAGIRSNVQEKRLYLDGVEVDKLSTYLGWLPVVTLLLDDIRIVRGSPGERRAFLDLALSKVSRPYLVSLGEYRRVLLHRNRLLTQRADDALYRTWEEQLAQAGGTIYELRNRYLPDLLRGAGAISAELFDTEATEFSYHATVNTDGDVRASFREALERHRPREQELGFTLAGPHRDDIMISKAGRELRRFGSEGEQRSASIGLKLAEAELLYAQRRESPVLLIDEVASELDPERSRRLFALLATRGQVFYAAAKPIPGQGRVFHVEAGKIQAA